MEGTSRGECSHLGNATGFFFFFFLNLSKPYSKQDDGVGGGGGEGDTRIFIMAYKNGKCI